MEKKHQKLYLPALRAHFGDWIYYTTIMKLSDIGERVNYADDLYQNPKLKDLLQRELKSSRAKEIAEYLLKNEQRFFNAIIVGVYGGEPKWLEININKVAETEIPLSESGILGYLELNGSETLFALDGQHRISGIRNALKQISRKGINTNLPQEEMSVIFIGHKTTEEGKERTRRLFTTLNRNAKKVSLSETVALDEDDIAAILSRKLVENYILFNEDKISLTKGSSISRNDHVSFTNIVTLYKCLNEILVVYLLKEDILGSKKKWRDYKKFRPADEVLENGEEFLAWFWDLFIEHFDELNTYLRNYSQDQENPAADFRSEVGGSLLFRPIGLHIFVQVISIMYQYGHPIEEIIDNLSILDRRLNSDIWSDIIWDPRSNKMLYSKDNKDLAKYLTLYLLGFDLNRIRYSETKLRELYSSIKKKDIDEIILPEKINP